MKYALILITMVFSLPVFSFTVRGNGGFLVECPTGKFENRLVESKVEVLDTFEGNLKYHLPLNYSPNESLWGKIQEYLLRAHHLQIAHYSQMSLILEHLKKNMILNPLFYVRVGDTGALNLGKCYKVLGALQRAKDYTNNFNQVQYQFNEYYWKNRLNSDQRAVLVLHELLYTYYLQFQPINSWEQITSEKVREQVYKILTSKML